MRYKKVEHLLRNNHGKIIDREVEVLPVNKENQTFNDFWFSDEIFNFNFYNRLTGEKVPKFILFYKNKSVTELQKKYFKK